MRIGLGLIVRNEAPYLVEWLAWHLVIGVTDFVIYDNDSDDGSTELLKAMAKVGLITYVPFPDQPDRRPQMHAYKQMIENHAADFDWMGLIDADEFLMPTGTESLKEILERMPADCGGLLINWAVFGSSGIDAPDDPLFPSPVMERFQRRAKRDFLANKNFKSIFRGGYGTIQPGHGNCHNVILRSNFAYYSASGVRLDVPTDGTAAIVAPANWGQLRINHYLVKSWYEFIFKKRARGDASEKSGRNVDFFESFRAANRVLDPPPAELMARARKYSDQIWQHLRRAGLDDWKPTPIPTLISAADCYEIEAIYWDTTAKRYALDGWSYDGFGQANISEVALRMCVENVKVAPHSITLLPRADLKENRPWVNDFVGLRVIFSGLPAPTGTIELRAPNDVVATLSVESIQFVETLPEPKIVLSTTPESN